MNKIMITYMLARESTKPCTLSFFIYISAICISMAALLVQGCASSNNIQSGTLSRSEAGTLLIQRNTDEYLIRAGDLIEISVWGYEEFTTSRTVTGRGMITIPLIGEMEARDLTKEEFTENLRGELATYIQGEITLSVSITSTGNNMVSVLGAVERADNYEIIESASLFEILSRAGGTTNEADLRNVTIYRRGGTNMPAKIDLTPYLNGLESPDSITPIAAGDIVYVPREENVVRELSTFMRDVVLLFGMFRILN